MFGVWKQDLPVETKNKSPQVLLSSRWFPPVSQKTFSKQERQKNFPDPLRLFGTVRNRCKLLDHFISSDLVFLYVRHMVQHGEAKSPEVISASTLVPRLKLWWPYSLGWQFSRDLFIKQIWWTPMISVPSWGGHSRSQWHWFLVHGHGLNTFHGLGRFETWKERLQSTMPPPSWLRFESSKLDVFDSWSWQVLFVVDAHFGRNW